MPSVLREYTLGERGEKSGLGWGDLGVRRTGLACGSSLLGEVRSVSVEGRISVPTLDELAGNISAPESVRL